MEHIYSFGFIGLFVVTSFLDNFMPLMLTSVYCAVGISYSWIVYYMDALA
jgi:hypothetical protein